jgi:predicted aldo/keto reductase-like oxidoreductase
VHYNKLGNSGIKVSRLCFGSLTISPLQANLPVKEGSAVIRAALEQGVNFIDTAKIYDNYDHIKEAIKGDFSDTVIASKSYNYTREGMQKSLTEALRGIGRDYIDIFLLHEQDSALTIKGHWEAVEYLVAARRRGIVRAIGISTHSVECVRAAALVPEFDVIHPLINKYGIGIQDGSAEDMLAAIAFARSAGKGIYGMKALGGGNLISRKNDALEFILGIEELSSIAVGMQSVDEVNYNIKFFAGKPVAAAIEKRLAERNRYLHIEQWCRGCGSCMEKCSAGALSVLSGRAVVDPGLCRLCGYCSTACPDFCIKII